MLTTGDIKTIEEIINKAVAPVVTKEEAKGFATKDDLRNFATKDDLRNFATKDDLKSLVTKADFAKLETSVVKIEVEMTGQFSALKSRMSKNVKRLETCMKTERKLRNEDFGHLEKEDRKISLRVAKIEHHLGFAPAL